MINTKSANCSIQTFAICWLVVQGYFDVKQKMRGWLASCSLRLCNVHRVIVVDWSFTMLLTSQVISVAFYIEHDKSDKFCSEALISAWGSFMYLNLRHGTHRFTSLPKEVILRIFTLWKFHRPWLDLNPQTSDPVESMITTGTPGLTVLFVQKVQKLTIRINILKVEIIDCKFPNG